MDLKTRDRIISKFIPEPNSGCWLWTAAVSKGYGKVWFGGKVCAAHRVVYTIFRGEIPEGLQLDHLCRTPLCVNPDHLEPVTSAENTRRGNSPFAVNARKTHCPRGHEYTADNILKIPGGKTCKTCKYEYLKRYSREVAVPRRNKTGKPAPGKRTHCPRGHEYNEENTRRALSSQGYMTRHCKQCVRDRRTYTKEKSL